MTKVHPTAIVHSDALLGGNVVIGPYCVIEGGARIGDDCQLASHVVIRDRVSLGKGNIIHESAVLGGRPQHRQATADTGNLEIGACNIIREYVTIHPALRPGNATVVGDHNYFMIHSHVGHDCKIGTGTTLVNNVMLGGHVDVGDYAIMSGGAAAHQFSRIGQYAMVGGMARITQDVPPYVLVDGESNCLVGLNIIGLRRNGFSNSEIRDLKAAYRLIFRSGTDWNRMLDELNRQFPTGPAANFHPFFISGKRGFLLDRQASRHSNLRLAPSEGVDRRPQLDFRLDRAA